MPLRRRDALRGAGAAVLSPIVGVPAHAATARLWHEFGRATEVGPGQMLGASSTPRLVGA